MMTIDFIFKSHGFSISALVKWILSACLNIHTLQLKFPNQPKSFLNEIGRLTKLKKLDVSADKASRLKEVTLIASNIKTTLLTSSQIVRSCRQVEILRMDVQRLTLVDLNDLEPAENTTDLTLFWEIYPHSIEYVLEIVKRWRQLHRLTLRSYKNKKKRDFLPFEVLKDFIMEMKHLSHLHIGPDDYGYNYDQLVILRYKVKNMILPRHPNFKFKTSRL